MFRGIRQKLKNGDEYDWVFRKTRYWHYWPAGRAREIKRRLNRRFRKDGHMIEKNGAAESEVNH